MAAAHHEEEVVGDLARGTADGNLDRLLPRRRQPRVLLRVRSSTIGTADAWAARSQAVQARSMPVRQWLPRIVAGGKLTSEPLQAIQVRDHRCDAGTRQCTHIADVVGGLPDALVLDLLDNLLR